MDRLTDRVTKYKADAGLGHFPMSEDPEAFFGHLLPVLDKISTLPARR